MGTSTSSASTSTGPTPVELAFAVWPMESVPVLDDRMYLPACSAARSKGPFTLASQDQPPDPVFELCHTVETVIAPSPPVKVPSVVVNDSPTLAVPLTDGDFAFLQEPSVLALHLASPAHMATCLLQRNNPPALLEQWTGAWCFHQSDPKPDVFHSSDKYLDLIH